MIHSTKNQQKTYLLSKYLRICPERNFQVSLFNSKFVHMNLIVLTSRCWVRSALSYDVGLNSYIWGRQPLVWSWFGVDFSAPGFLIGFLDLGFPLLSDYFGTQFASVHLADITYFRFARTLQLVLACLWSIARRSTFSSDSSRGVVDSRRRFTRRMLLVVLA